MEEKTPKLFYGYVIVAAGFGIMMIMHGIFSVFGIFFDPLLEEFGSSRATLSGVASVTFIIMGLMAMIVGVLADKFGPRRVLTACGLFFAAGLLLMSLPGAIWQVYLFYFLIGVGLSASDVVPLTMVARWFIKRRGTMSGIMKVGTGLGMMVMPLVVHWLIASFGWRTSYFILGILALVTVISLAQFLRRDPREMGQLPDGERQLAAGGPDLGEEGLSLREAIRTRQLWLVCGAYLMIIFSAQTVLLHIVPHVEDLGVSKANAAAVLSTIGGASMLGRLVMGFTSDKIGNKRAMLVCFLILIIALSWLQLAGELWMFYLFAAVYGFSHGGFFALISPTIAGLFGTRSQGTLLGVVLFSGAMGGAIGPILAGTIFDITDSYRLAFIILVTVAIIGSMLTMLLKPISYKR